VAQVALSTSMGTGQKSSKKSSHFPLDKRVSDIYNDRR